MQLVYEFGRQRAQALPVVCVECEVEVANRIDAREQNCGVFHVPPAIPLVDQVRGTLADERTKDV